MKTKFLAFLVKMIFQVKRCIFLRKNTWQGIVPFTKIKYKGKNFLYMWINEKGGPGMSQIPEPMFCGVNASWEEINPHVIYYLRQTGGQFPEDVFGEHKIPIRVGDSDTFIGFLNATVSDLEIVRE